MDSSSLNQYEERLYSVFKTFDVNNEEALNKSEVLALCDALQLEQRGAALADTLFERRDQRVTFTQFRSGLLAVLGDTPAPAPAPEPGPPPPPSDDDSSGREVAPKFVFGSKKYGRRSRPPRPATSSPGAPDPPAAGEDSPELELEHDRLVTSDGALQLCRRLRMDGVDRRLVERCFENAPRDELSVGEFFDRLNSSLTSTIHDACAGEGAGGGAGEDEEALPVEAVLECWERAGVARGRRLLGSLGLAGPALPAARLAAALGDELRAQGPPLSPRALLPLAALGVAGLRLERARAAARDAAAERDRLRADLDEAHRRARVLAQEVDDNTARLEAELTASLRRADARAADALRRRDADAAIERERAAAEKASLEAELARRADVEQRLRADAASLADRIRELETRCSEAEARAAADEREAGRLREELRAAAGRLADERAAARAAGEGAARREGALRDEAARLRDRCDELAARLERPVTSQPPAPPPPQHSWHEEAAGAIGASTLEEDSPPVSFDSTLSPQAITSVHCPAGDAGGAGGAGEGGTGEEAASLRAQLAEAEARHDDEKQKLEALVKDLEKSLEAMREEYERCEEYWSSKLRDERALAASEQRAADERLASLVESIAEYERQYRCGRGGGAGAGAGAGALLPVPEAPALEAQAAALEDELRAVALQREQLAGKEDTLMKREELMKKREEQINRREMELVRREREQQRCVAALEAMRRIPMLSGGGVGGGGGGGGGGGIESELRGRLARAEAAVRRLGARLAAADLLVKDLYLETCRPQTLTRPF